MSDEELRKLETSMYAWLAARGKPASHDDLLEWARTATDHFSPVAVRRSVWRLVSQDKIDFTPEWRVVAAG